MEEFNGGCIQKQNPWGGPGVMTRGAIGSNQRLWPMFCFLITGPGKGSGVTAHCYVNQMPTPHIHPYLQQHADATFQQDNSRPPVTKACVQQHNTPTYY